MSELQNLRHTCTCTKHSKSQHHHSATEAYAMKSSGATVPARFYRLTNEHEQVNRLLYLYEKQLLAFKDVASLKYNSLNKLVELQRCESTSIRNRYVGENAKYTIPEVVKEMKEVFIKKLNNVESSCIDYLTHYSIDVN